MSNAVESGWQRFCGWMNRQWRSSVDLIAAGAPGAGGRELRTVEQVQSWEDEGGAPAPRAVVGSGSEPASRADPQH